MLLNTNSGASPLGHPSRLVALFVCAVALAGACNRKAPPSTIGSEVDAPSPDGTMAAGRVSEQYGKLARVTFDRITEAWIQATELEPSAMPSPPPPQDTCKAAVDDRVRAPWALTRKMYAGRVIEVHGRFALVRFDDGDKTWAPCDAIVAYQRNGE